MPSFGETLRNIYRKISVNPASNSQIAEGLRVEQNVPFRKIRRRVDSPMERFRIANGGCQDPHSRYNELATDPDAFAQAYEDFRRGPAVR